MKSIKDEALTSENEKGRTLELSGNQSRYLSYAYATTVHKSQGLTCDKVLFNIDTKSLTTSKDVFYVGISRARYEVSIYTDDKAKLSSAISKEIPITKATDIDRFNGLEARFRPVELTPEKGPAGAEKN